MHAQSGHQHGQRAREEDSQEAHPLFPNVGGEVGNESDIPCMSRTDVDRIALLKVGNGEIGHEPGGHAAAPHVHRRQGLPNSGWKVSDRFRMPEPLFKGVQHLFGIMRRLEWLH
jgi:hypothetical protein